jgi:hypothetical protein
MARSELPPWEQAPYFQPPTQVTFALTETTVQIAPADPMRAWICFSQPGTGGVSGGSAVVGVADNTGWSVANNWLTGIVIGANPLILTIWDNGPIVCQRWLGASSSSMGFNLSIMYQSLYGWPDGTEDMETRLQRTFAQPPPPPPNIPALPGADQSQSVLSYWQRIMRLFGAGKK